MLSLVQPHHYYQNLLAQGVGMGIGMGIMFLPSLTLTSHYFRARRSLAMGIVLAGDSIFSLSVNSINRSWEGSSLGGCLYPILLNNVFQSSSRFGTGVRCVFPYSESRCLIIHFRAVAFMDLGLLIIANLVMRTRLPPKHRGNENASILKEVTTDVPYLVFVFGSFLVCFA